MNAAADVFDRWCLGDDINMIVIMIIAIQIVVINDINATVRCSFGHIIVYNGGGVEITCWRTFHRRYIVDVAITLFHGV